MNTLPRFRKEVSHGGIIPRGWKLAWYEPRRRVGVYCPAPLHWIFRAARECTRPRSPGAPRAHHRMR